MTSVVRSSLFFISIQLNEDRRNTDLAYDARVGTPSLTGDRWFRVTEDRYPEDLFHLLVICSVFAREKIDTDLMNLIIEYSLSIMILICVRILL